MNRVFNEEQFEAYQAEVTRKAEEFILSLPEPAREKASKIRELVGELNKLGTPYYLFIQEPCVYGYHWPVQYNNLLETFPPVNGRIDAGGGGVFNANFFYALIGFLANSFSHNDNSGKHPLEIFSNFVTTSLAVMESPAYEEELRVFTERMNKIWGMELKPFKVNYE